jgi:UDP-glucose 4-epimerase
LIFVFSFYTFEYEINASTSLVSLPAFYRTSTHSVVCAHFLEPEKCIAAKSFRWIMRAKWYSTFLVIRHFAFRSTRNRDSAYLGAAAQHPLPCGGEDFLIGSNVLVTGGAGYIGSATAALLSQQGYRVTIVDNLSRGHRQAVPGRAQLIIGDIGDTTFLEQVFDQGCFDAVLHFAGLIEAGESMQVPERYFRNNAANTLTLLERVLIHKVPRFVFSSTAAIYGEPTTIPIDETAILQPTNAYGESKLCIERMLAWFHRIHGLRYGSLRYFNAAGAREGHGENHDPESHLIPLILQVALGQRDCVSIYGTDYPTPDGTCVRDYIHVSDLALAHLLVLEALQKESQCIYNLGNGRGFSVRQVIETARRVTLQPIPANDVQRRSGDPAVLISNSEKIHRELGWEPRYSDLTRIIQSAWEWHRSHPHGYA